ncbi:FtsX-like permease family protein [Candidatus Riesia pediculischaeffi]|nr:FtsX-like permease family protein [Candidatus Riesia pediculischaeffi]
MTMIFQKTYLLCWFSYRIIKNRRGGNLISWIRWISKLSIISSISIMIIALSVIRGFEVEFQKKILSFIPHGYVDFFNQPCTRWKTMMTHLSMSKEIKNVFPYVKFIGILEKSNAFVPIKFIGIDFSENIRERLFSKMKVNSTEYLFSDKSSIILGKNIAERINASLGDHLNIIVTSSIENIGKVGRRSFDLKMVEVNLGGIVESECILDDQIAILPIQSSQEYLGYGSGISGFQVEVEDIFSVGASLLKATNGYRYHNRIDKKFIIRTWIDEYGYIYQDIQSIKSIAYVITFFMVCIACLNVMYSVESEIDDRSREISIISSIGAENNFIKRIFLLIWTFRGIVYCSIGSILGFFISINLTKIFSTIENIFCFQIKGTYFIDFFPSYFKKNDLFFISMIVLLLMLFSAIRAINRAVRDLE